MKWKSSFFTATAVEVASETRSPSSLRFWHAPWKKDLSTKSLCTGTLQEMQCKAYKERTLLDPFGSAREYLRALIFNHCKMENLWTPYDFTCNAFDSLQVYLIKLIELKKVRKNASQGPSNFISKSFQHLQTAKITRTWLALGVSRTVQALLLCAPGPSSCFSHLTSVNSSTGASAT